MNALVAFNFEGLDVRVFDRTGAPWFVLADVCRVLGISNPRDAAARLDPEERNTVDSTDGIRTGPGNPNMTIINESGFYALTMSSRKPEAKRFKRWVTSEVLPTIRRTGSFGRPAPLNLGDARALRQALLSYTADVIALQDEVAELAPKAAALDRLEDGEGSMSVTAAAKALDLKPRELFSRLSRLCWIYRRADDGPWMAYQSAIDSGRLRHRMHTVPRPSGPDRVEHQVLVTAKGWATLSKLLAATSTDGEGLLAVA